MMGKLLAYWLSFALMAAAATSAHYFLNNYTFGAGGGITSSSHYSDSGTAGDQSGLNASSSDYAGQSGEPQTIQAFVPPAPTFTNGNNYYDKLKFVINTGNNPTDATYAIAISSDNFATTYYLKTDDTIGSTLTSANFQTYAAWGGSSGQFAIGLAPSTTYEIKVAASQGNYTQTQFGPQASAATVAPYLNFEIDVSATDQTTTPPYNVAIGNLLPGTVITAPVYIWNTLDSNADSGGGVYVSSQNSGLKSSAAGYTIASANANLSAAGSGEGAQNASITQTAGGPFTVNAPYNGSAQNVGLLDNTVRELYASGAPVTHGRASLALKAKAGATTPAAPDYQDTLTMIAVASF